MEANFLEGNGSSFSEDNYPSRPGTEGVRTLRPLTERKPVSRARPYFGNVIAYDGGDRRLGYRYIRMPYISRDYLSATAQAIARLFKSTEDGADVNFLARRKELGMDGAFGVVAESTAEQRANATVHAAFWYKYSIAEIIVSAILLLRLGKLAGFTVSRKMGAMLKMTNIKGVLSPIFGLPYPKSYVNNIIAQAVELVQSDSLNGTTIIASLLIPFGANYVSDVVGLDYAVEGNAIPPDVLALQSGSAWAKAVTDAGETATLAYLTNMATAADYGSYSHKANRFFSYLLGQLEKKVDVFCTRFVTSAIPCLNVAKAGSAVYDFWVEQGLAEPDRFAEKDWLDGVSAIKTADLDGYANRFMNFLHKPSPIAVPFRTADNVATGPGTYGASLACVNTFGGTPFDYCKETKDVVLDAFRANTTDDYGNDIPWFTLRPARLSFESREFIPNAIDQFFDCLNADIDKRAHAFVDTYYGGTRGLSSDMAQFVMTHFANFLITTKRYVEPGKLGAFMDAGLKDSNVYVNEAILRGGVFMPQWYESPVIDQADPYACGIFLLIDTEKAGVGLDAAQANSWEQVLKLAAAVPAAAVRHANGVLVAAGMYIGDGALLPPLVHLSRSDVFPLEQTSLLGATFGVPAIPYRQVKGDFSFRSASVDGIIDSPNDVLSITLDSVSQPTHVTAVVLPSTVGGYAWADFNPRAAYDYENYEMDYNPIMQPLAVPSLRRYATEYTDNGLYAWLENCFGRLSDLVLKSKGQKRAPAVLAEMNKPKPRRFDSKDKKSYPSRPPVKAVTDGVDRGDEKVDTTDIGTHAMLGTVETSAVAKSDAGKQSWESTATDKLGDGKDKKSGKEKRR